MEKVSQYTVLYDTLLPVYPTSIGGSQIAVDVYKKINLPTHFNSALGGNYSYTSKGSLWLLVFANASDDLASKKVGFNINSRVRFVG